MKYCHRECKLCHKTKRDAIKAMRKMNKRKKGITCTYRCEFCGDYHISGRKKGKVIA